MNRISRLIGDAEPDESHHRSHRRLFRLASSINLVTRSKILSLPLEKVGEIYLRFLWISKVKCFSPSSSILYIGRIVVLRSLVTIFFHPWAWIRGERFKFIRPRRRRKSWGTIDYEASRDFASNRGRAVEIKTSLAYRNWLETIAGNRDVPCVRLLNGRVVVPIDRKKIFRFA